LQGRVGGQLAITRALGDLAFKTIVFFYLIKGASNIPEIQEFEINEHTPFLIIASDGLWDVCDD
jgi:serine/threonine protein phosphatase PrpC